MCDYSLMGLPSRLAAEGEQLVTHRFPTHTIGLAAAGDLAKAAAERGGGSWWSKLKLSMSGPEPVCAVCIPPGARLLLRDIPKHLQSQLGVGAEEEVTFTQLTASAYHYRDAVRFRKGREILLQRLGEGQRVEVLCLSLAADSTEGEGQGSGWSHTDRETLLAPGWAKLGAATASGRAILGVSAVRLAGAQLDLFGAATPALMAPCR